MLTQHDPATDPPACSAEPPGALQPPAAGVRWKALLAILLLVPAPSLGTAVAMMIEPTAGTTFGKVVYAVSKAWILALPLVWLLLVDKGRPGLSPMRRGGLLVGAALGLLIAAVVWGVYLVIGGELISVPMMRENAREVGIGSIWTYLPFVAYLALVNALLEEYVWRWFVFRKCEVLIGGPAAVVASALFFTIHHVIALRAQMDWTPTLLASAGVFIGGAVWSWCYLRYRSIWPGYLSHLIVDVAIFAIGWMVLFGQG